MNVLVLTSKVPFARGGAEVLCENLVLNLRQRGVNAEAMPIPFSLNRPERLIQEMLVARSLRLFNVDRVIALNFPAYLVPWRNKVIWLINQFRHAYDLWDAGASNIPRGERGEVICTAIRRGDDLAFSEAEAIFTVSPRISERFEHYNRWRTEALAYPLNDPELFVGGASDGYILASGSVSASKRQYLLIQALRHAYGVRLVIAGPPDTPGDATMLWRAAEAAGVQDRLTINLRFLPRTELAALFNRALAVAYLPYDADSVGYITMEAFQAAKPVLTVRDAGAVLQLVRHNETGLVVEPTPEALGEAMRELVGNPTSAARMGVGGRKLLDRLGLTWGPIVERLLA